MNNSITKEEFSSLLLEIKKLNGRLDKLEFAAEGTTSVQNVMPHPSKEHMTMINSMVDGLFNKHEMEKACAFEPNAKPCDHCSMCSSHGF